MERLTTPGFNFNADFVASHPQSWSIAQALGRLQMLEDILGDEYDLGRLRALVMARDTVTPNAPLTLEELRGMDGEPVWCEDNTVDAGIIRLAENWATGRLEADFWTFDEDGNPRCYNVRLTLEMGARFYRRKPEILAEWQETAQQEEKTE